MPDSKLKEREREARLKALREELEAEIEEKLARGSLSLPASPAGGRGSEPANVTSAEGGSASGGEAISDLPAGEAGIASSALRPPRNDESSNPVAPKRILEAVLFATAKPLTIPELRKIMPGVNAKELERLVQELREEYGREGRSFELIEIAGGFEIVTPKEYAPWLARLELQRKARQASRSALETLAILAYKQPVTRAEIEELRGVDISGVLSTLLEKGFIKIVGKKEVAGRPFLYGTTEKFLEHFGLKSLAGLPPIGEIKTLVERAVRKEELIDDGSKTPAPEN